MKKLTYVILTLPTRLSAKPLISHEIGAIPWNCVKYGLAGVDGIILSCPNMLTLANKTLN